MYVCPRLPLNDIATRFQSIDLILPTADREIHPEDTTLNVFVYTCAVQTGSYCLRMTAGLAEAVE